MDVRARWDETYRALLPQALRPADELQREFAEAVFHAWLLWHGDPSDGELDAPIGDEEILALHALQESCSLGWRHALLGQGGEKVGRPYGGPHGLWGAPLRITADEGFRSPPLPRPSRLGAAYPELPVRRPLRDALADVRNQFAPVVDIIRDVHAAVTSVPGEGRPSDDRLREVVARLCADAWHREVEVDQRRGWDDAEWWQYLGLEERLPWMAVALGLPGEFPERYGDLVDAVAGRTATGASGPELPAGFVAELGEACVRLALTEDEPSKER